MVQRPYHHGDLRAAMLAAAETVLDRAGVDGLSLRAAAREAGVSHAAPVHHFGDLSGLLSALAAAGFVRFRAHLAEAEAACADPDSRFAAFGTAYIGFARAHPGLFQLMFRSERLDWSVAELVQAAEAAFSMLLAEDREGVASSPPDFDGLVLALSRWSLAHGAAMLSLAGRIDALAFKYGADADDLVAAIARNVSLAASGANDGEPGAALRPA